MSDEPVRHAIDPVLEDELPGLALWSMGVSARPGPTTRALRQQLRDLAGRVTGAKAVALRQQSIPHAYRVFFRHTGVDPDQTRTPIEQAILDRMFHGGFASKGRVTDSLLIALLETGVPVWALDEAAVSGALTLRLGRAEDPSVPSGRLALADDERALGELFGPWAPGVTQATEAGRLRLVSVAVKGVPALCVEEALFLAAEAMSDEDIDG